jgi:hypothetical protein
MASITNFLAESKAAARRHRSIEGHASQDHHRSNGDEQDCMIQRLLHSKNFLACLLAAATGLVLYIRLPFPEDNFFFELMFLFARPVFNGFKYTYILFLYTTPYICHSVLLSGLYIFALKIPQRIRTGRLPRYPDPRKRPSLALAIGEIHNPRKPVPARDPHWLIVPKRGLFTGVAIFGAIGSGKTSCCMYPFAEQILGYKASEKDRRIGGLAPVYEI